MTGDSGERGQHPVDVLIRSMIENQRQPASAEVDQIAQRMAGAPFNTGVVPVRTRFRGLTYKGITLGSRENSFTVHFVKRIVAEQQWAIGTEQHEFISDIRKAPLAPSSRLLAYNRWGEYFVAAICSTSDAIPQARLGPGAEPFLLFVYSVDKVHIETAYMFSSLERLNLPQEVLWIR